ncbi:hypothetical protein H696_06068 [Fonticula alba]|uniref:Uncharacterized protein n=1 Tax=Fonticula alba TaxID=691883 RepID=A0A058YZX8_FONAL|nr:hypothetical protein H696_06068 [Fonticula alba]KCV67549.1 hypothetical protein H696_06068 [Fonticula alba]|eukprot:XP_009498110.1 hypothetical protein H696_06068 [Fonticula alba]
MAPVRRAQPPRAGQAAGHALPGAFNVTLALSMCLGAAGPGRLVSSSVVIPPELRHTVRLSPDLLADLLGAGSPVSAIRLPARISFASESRRTIHQCLLPDASLSRGVLALPRELAEELSLWQARGPIRAMLDLDTPVVGTLLAEITGHQADGQPPADLALVASEVEQALGRSGDKLHAPVSLCLPSGRVVSIGSLLRLSCAMLPPGHFPHEWCSSDLQQHEGHFVGGVSRVVFRMPAAMVGHVPLACRALALVAGEAAGDAVLLRPVADRGLPTNGMLVSLPVLPPALDRLFGLTCQSLGEALVFDIGGRQFRLLCVGRASGCGMCRFSGHPRKERGGGGGGAEGVVCRSGRLLPAGPGPCI